MQDINAHIQSKKLLEGFDLIKKKRHGEAEIILLAGLKEAELNGDKILAALFYSALGVLYKVQKDFRKAWKQYERAEKLLPDDLSLKIISARLLVDYFGQYDLVFKKMNKVLSASGGFAPFDFQAHTIIGLAHLRKGSKKGAVEALKASMECLGPSLDSVVHVDFELVEGILAKNIEPDLCLEFLTKARDLASHFKEDIMKKFIQKLIDCVPGK